MDWIVAPLQLEFMRTAIAIGVMLGILCSVVGSFMLVRQMGMLGDAISHSVLAGLPVAYVLGLPLSVGAVVAGVLSALMLAWIESNSKLKIDTVMALILSTFLAVGVMLVSVLPGANRIDLIHVLFGNILGVTRGELWLTVAIAVSICLVTALFYKELLLYSLDPVGAQAAGLPVRWYYAGSITAITLTVVASLQTVGILLVIAMLVGPAMTAYLLVKELHEMMLWGAAIGASASVTGMYASYYLDVPSGAAIVLMVFAFFFLAFLFSPSQGLLTQPSSRQRAMRMLQGFAIWFNR